MLLAEARDACDTDSMIPPSSPVPNAYTGSPLDRASERRRDAEWLAACRHDDASRFVPMWRGKVMLRGQGGAPVAALLSGAEAQACREAERWALLGLQDGVAVFAADLGPEHEVAPLPELGRFEDLRTVVAGLDAGEAAILAHARGLMVWRGRTLFCAGCGAPTAPQEGGTMLACTRCGTHHFPRTDPAVIMLVTHRDRALLGHAQRFANTAMYSTLAGFVEPGESLEEAVAREVFEEAGVRVARARYHSSQPWPFPSSIMLGFYAEASDEAIRVDGEELTDARWFTRAQVRDRASGGFDIPPPDSIARRLIDDWVAAGESKVEALPQTPPKASLWKPILK